MKKISYKNIFMSACLSFVCVLGLVSSVKAADRVAPVVNAVGPNAAKAGQVVQISMFASDQDSGINNCYVTIDAATLSTDMRLAAGDSRYGVFVQDYTFAFPGTYLVGVRCVDREGNMGQSANTSLVVTATEPTSIGSPYVGTISPVTAVAGTPVTFTATYSDDIGVTSCQFDPGTGTFFSPTLSGSPARGILSYTYTYSSPGTYNISVRCSNAGGGLSGGFASVTVTGSGRDITPPVVRPIPEAFVTLGAPYLFGVEYSDNVGVTACFLSVNGSSVGFATLSGTPAVGTASRSYTFSAPGTYAVGMTCRDEALNSGESGNRTVVVASSAPPADVAAPTFTGTISPLSATVGSSVTLSLGYADNVGVTECYLYVDGALAGGSTSGGMTGTTSRAHTFTTSGAHTARFQCRDAAGNQGVSTTYTVNVAAAPSSGGGSGGSGGSGSSVGSVPMGTLIKAICPTTGVVNADHPCRAVYYYGQDGRRHAFPNERVYFTWFSDFSGVREVSAGTMASITLGRNVTYRPGSRMIKFRTVNRVYAVSRGGTLRWITTEDVARQLYGSNWATKVDDVGDTFYSNYVSGSDITLATQFNIPSETSAAPTIDQNW